MLIAPTTSAFSSKPHPTHTNRACVCRLFAETCPQPFVGFPVFVLAIALAIIGAWQKIFWLPALAALLSLPLGFYLQGNSDLGLLVWLVPLSLLGVAYSLRKEKTRLAWLLLLPGVFLLIMLAIALVAFLNIRG